MSDLKGTFYLSACVVLILGAEENEASESENTPPALYLCDLRATNSVKQPDSGNGPRQVLSILITNSISPTNVTIMSSKSNTFVIKSAALSSLVGASRRHSYSTVLLFLKI